MELGSNDAFISFKFHLRFYGNIVMLNKVKCSFLTPSAASVVANCSGEMEPLVNVISDIFAQRPMR